MSVTVYPPLLRVHRDLCGYPFFSYFPFRGHHFFAPNQPRKKRNGRKEERRFALTCNVKVLL